MKIIIKSPLLNEFTKELGNLLAIRISEYLRKFHNSDEIKFFNKFIICPTDYDADASYAKTAALSRKHFEENLNIDFAYISLVGIALTHDKKIQYFMHFDTSFLADFTDDETFDEIEFSYIDQECKFQMQEFIEYLELINDEAWEKIIRVIRGEISLGTIKKS